jgi:protein SCO1/2
MVFKNRMNGSLLLWIMIFLLIFSSYHTVYSQQEVDEPEVGILEHLGGFIPLDLTFHDETGESVILEDIINKPTVATLVFFRCGGVCPRILSGVSIVLDKIPLEPGQDYKVLTLSFDDTDTPEFAAEKKKNYTAAFSKAFPEEAWTFLTGDRDNISKFTEAVGFKYKQEGDFFVHPAALIVLSPEGKIVRYIYGTSYLPFDMKMALLEASEGRVGSTITKVLQFCYSYDPQGKTYVFNILKVSATLIIFFAILFIIFLMVYTRMKKRETR